MKQRKDFLKHDLETRFKKYQENIPIPKKHRQKKQWLLIIIAFVLATSVLVGVIYPFFTK